MTRDVEPPALRVVFPTLPVLDDRVLVEGTAESGAVVFIGDTEVRTAVSGEFAHEVSLERGVNVVVVEAVDAAGNVTYRSKLVHAKF